MKIAADDGFTMRLSPPDSQRYPGSRSRPRLASEAAAAPHKPVLNPAAA